MLPDTIHSGGFSTFDASLSKDWKFKERFDAQFRIEAFNLLNRTIYAGASTFLNLGAPKSFGIAELHPGRFSRRSAPGPRRSALHAAWVEAELLSA